MVKGCNRGLSRDEIIYTVPEKEYGWENGKVLPPDSVGKLFTAEAGDLTHSVCGLTYSHERGRWLCRECATEAGWIW